MRKIFFALIVLFALFSCNSSKEVVDVQNINNLTTSFNNHFIYSLPKTKIIVVVEVEKIIQNKGPFTDYTDTYLGALNNVIMHNETFWNISNVNFFSYPIIDTSNTYVVGLLDDNTSFPLKLTRNGFLISFNNPDVDYHSNEIEHDLSGLNDNSSQNLSFNFVSSDKSYKVVYDTVYKEEVYDTIIKQVPILKPNLVKKTPEEQAKELADRITLLRDDRAALLVGEADNDNLPTGNALAIMLAEIDKLEAEYLSMFIGRSDTLKYTYTFSYTPTNNLQHSVILFKFSQRNGLLPAENIYGTPVYFKISSNDLAANISDYNYNLNLSQQMNRKPLNKGLYYRIPKQASVKLVFNSQVVSETKMFVAQHGTIQYLPANFFKNPNLKIDFYPELGSIKSVSFQ